jgi:hypothetical protein
VHRDVGPTGAAGFTRLALLEASGQSLLGRFTAPRGGNVLPRVPVNGQS